LPEFSLTSILLACLASLVAGFIDAIVGGGGLITTPALLLLFPEAPIASILATTKVASIFGTTAAAVTYQRRMQLEWRRWIPSLIAAIVAAWLGASAVSHLDPEILRPAILVLLVVMAVYTALRPNLGAKVHAGFISVHRGTWLIVTCVLLGFYDGFFGPGTGSLLVWILIMGFGNDFLRASAHAKFINLASNLGALLWFLPAGSAIWILALPMAACNMVGGLLGSRFALKVGNTWIRWAFLALVTALIVRLSLSML
jgi:uncharacterized protein